MNPLTDVLVRLEVDQNGFAHWRAYALYETGEVPIPNTSKHSPTGFNIGYGGSGPAALAESILRFFYGKPGGNPERYQAFKWEHIATLSPRVDQHIIPKEAIARYAPEKGEEEQEY